MALYSVVRRLHIKHTQLFSLSIPNSFCTPHLVPLHSISHAFYQTVSFPSQFSLPPVSRLTTPPLFTTQIEFNGHKLLQYDPREMGLVQFLELLKKTENFPSEAEATAFLDGSDMAPDKTLVCSAIWESREDWKVAILAFKLGDKSNCIDEDAYNLMIWVLGNHKKFHIAWSLIQQMHRSSMCTRRAMLIMADRYASANNPTKAIQTFHIMELFRLSPDQEAFQTVLDALCKHGNVEEAEEFMLVNKKLFPLDAAGFNIILNAWCNILVDVVEAKRIWREMAKYCITPDGTSYSHLISCYSKVRNLFDSLRVYDEMKKRGWVPGLEVYNSLIFVLTHENCLRDALKIIDKLEEKGLRANSATYNSLILPLCEAKKMEEARIILNMMIKENLSPTIETYHAFLEVSNYKETLEILKQMKTAGVAPSSESFLIILGKFFKFKKPVNALKIWMEMSRYKVESTAMHYKIMVEGLATSKWLIKAQEFYDEMRSNGFSEDPKLKKLLEERSKKTVHNVKHQIEEGIKDKRLSH